MTIKHDILGVGISSLTFDQLRGVLDEAVAGDVACTCFYANAHALNLAWDDLQFRSDMSKADVVFCDGFGAMLVARLLGVRLPQRMTPPDWLREVGSHWGARSYRLFLLGGAGDVAEKTATWYHQNYPNITIAGVHHGYFDKNGAESNAIIAQINRVNPHILIVGFGMPIQERWCIENRAKIHVPVIITVGAGMDYLSGTTKRAPQWATNRGLEWLGRLLIEPRRLWRRYLIGLPLLLIRTIGYRLGIAHPRQKEAS